MAATTSVPKIVPAPPGGARAYVHEAPPVRDIRVVELGEVLRLGWRDFMAAPSHLLFLVVIYPVAGLLIAQSSVQTELIPLLFPLLAGFALVGPFVGVGLYELSRRRERGEEVGLSDAFKVLQGRSIGAILALGLLLCALLVGWLFVADRLYLALIGPAAPASFGAFVDLVLGTADGWRLIILGHIAGFAFAAATLMISAVSFPMLVDRDAGVGVAVQTSIRAVRANPWTMTVWGLIIAAGLMAGSALMLVGLAIVIPVLAHASWHLYRRVVVWRD